MPRLCALLVLVGVAAAAVRRPQRRPCTTPPLRMTDAEFELWLTASPSGAVH